jgi:putative membrane protein
LGSGARCCLSRSCAGNALLEDRHMFIDYVALMLVNLSASLILLAVVVLRFLDTDGRKMAPGFFVTGFIAVATGLDMIFTWPLPSSYNIAFGELYFMFGVLIFTFGLAQIRGWDLLSLSIFAMFGGLASVVVGIRIVQRGMTDSPPLSACGFVITGLAGLLSLPVYAARNRRTLRVVLIVLLVAAAGIWAFMGFGAYWKHLQSFSQWKPG